MGYASCESWEYDNHPNIQGLSQRCIATLIALRTNPTAFQPKLADTRSVHFELFADLAPQACPYLAGQYRGDNFPCLLNYNVKLVGGSGDDRVGVPAADNLIHMGIFGAKVMQLAQKLDELSKKLSRTQLLAVTVPVLADVLVHFLTVHPYANGNGHMGRFIVWILLGRFGFWQSSWPFDDRPPYDAALSAHRNGNFRPMEDLLFKSIGA
ncbi:MAG: Fic family protein [Proteobacteria bacterium]|nr:Fic family protein [Pseudomonadota bacterium]